MKRKIIIGVLILIVAAGSAGYYFYSKKVQNYAEGEPDITVTAVEMLGAFDKDTASAVKRFMDKKVRVTGTVKTIDSSAVVLAEEGSASSVVIGLDDRNRKSISGLQTGKQATLQGKFSGYNKSSGDPEDLLAALGTTVNIDYGGIIKK